jgi:hypothetical protein
MGIEIHRDHFEEEDYARFSERLDACVRALRVIVARPGFGVEPPSIGSELELNLVGDDMRPMHINRAVLANVLDGRVTLEVDRFNLEINARPSPLAGRPFVFMERELREALAHTREAARAHSASVVTIGILPTLTEGDLTPAALSEGHRYRALSAGIKRLRRAAFSVHIEGDDVLDCTAPDVTFEGANTSFQVHLKVTPEMFAQTYNAAQIATAPALALAGNSPFFLGKRLWQETRVALFRQAVDDRGDTTGDDWRPARVSFGHGWARRGALELFEESVALHDPLLPVCGDEDPEAVVHGGGVPALSEMRLHHGTVWRWNRAVYDNAGGGHLRIELRALPAGPTVRDMVANAAFMVGLTLGLAPRADELVTRMTFGHARRNFYEAARRGLDAELVWPSDRIPAPALVGARELGRQLLPIARRGLLEGGVDADEADAWLAIIRDRLERGTTGAVWQRRVYDALRAGGASPLEAAAEMLARYRELGEAGSPVAEWPASTRP